MNINNVKMKNCKFFINEKKRVVVCVIENTQDILKDYIFENNYIQYDVDCCYYLNHHHSFGRLARNIEMPNRFVGIAKCSIDDEWDEKLGRLIAYNRARKKLYTSFFNFANNYMNRIDEYLDKDEQNFNKLGANLSKDIEYLDSVIEKKIGVKKEE